MAVKVWRSFSSNNSSSYYVVARFADPRKASDCAAELARYIEANDLELGAMTAPERRANRELSMANLEFAETIGLPWATHITLGYADDIDLEIAAISGDLAVYHDYCLGFDEALSHYLEKRGGSVGDGRWNDFPTVSVVVFADSNRSEADFLQALEAFFATGPDGAERFALASFNTPTASGIAGKLSVPEFDRLAQLASKHPGADFEIAVDRAGDVTRFRLIASARCLGCGNDRLDYLAKERADLPADQLACHKCGGMFALDSLSEEE